MQDELPLPGVGAWLSFTIFSAVFPTVVALLGISALVGDVRSQDEVEELLISLFPLTTFAVVGCTLILSVASDLVLNRTHLGHWATFHLIVFGSLAAAVVAISSYRKLDQLITRQSPGAIDPAYLAEFVILILSIVVCAFIKDMEFDRRLANRKLMSDNLPGTAK